VIEILITGAGRKSCFKITATDSENHGRYAVIKEVCKDSIE